MTLKPELAHFADLFPESILLVDRGGVVVFANDGAAELLQTSRAALIGRLVPELVVEPARKTWDYLNLCSRASHLAYGLLTFRRPGAEALPCRCEGGRLKGTNEPGILVIRQTPKRESSSWFTALNHEISELHRARLDLENAVLTRTRDLAEAQGALRDLSVSLMRAQDEERRRLARELHDSTGQLLTAIQLNLSVLLQKEKMLPADAVSKLTETVEMTNEAITEIRTLSYLLHPPMLDEAGLALALQWYVEGFQERSKIAIDLDMPKDLHRLGREMETAVFRVIQECLTNIHRHSGSAKACIRISLDDHKLILAVRDEGCGFSPTLLPASSSRRARLGVGVGGMRERVRQLGGSIDFLSANPGTLVRVELPLKGCAGNPDQGSRDSFPRELAV